jgi:hypothetical protein
VFRKDFKKTFSTTYLAPSIDKRAKHSLCSLVRKYFFCSILSEFENFLLCERILINVTTCQNETSMILSDVEPLTASANKKTLYSTRSCINWPFFGTRGSLKRSFYSRFKLLHSCQKRPNLHTNSLNKLLFRLLLLFSSNEFYFCFLF